MAANLQSDTIVARATPAGRGGVGIVRVSGPQAAAVAESLLGSVPKPRYATFSTFLDESGNTLDSGLALWFPGPNSFTGEDVLELQGHGGPVVLDMLLERIQSLGVRQAEPGEFSKRAFLNDKLDLTQAEAIVDLIDSGSQTAARAAHRSLQGAFSEAVLSLNDRLTELRVHVEAAIDFPDEDIDFLTDDALLARVQTVRENFADLNRSVRQGCLLRDGISVVLAGRPNAGKSSLLNRLAGYDAAIVTDIPGTTRDLVREHIDLDGIPLHVIDTAGLRATDDVVELEGVRRTRGQLDAADLALLILDSTENDVTGELLADLPDGLQHIIVRNKSDLSGALPGVAEDGSVNISATSGEGVTELRDAIKNAVGYVQDEAGSITARRRHLAQINIANEAFEQGVSQLEAGSGELMADDLLQAQNALANITGEFSSDDLLGEIFSNFCIGK